MSATAIIPAGGIGRRMGLDTPKQFHNLAGLPILVHTIRAFQQVAEISSIIVVVPEKHIPITQNMVAEYQLDKVTAITAGGTLRQDSVKAGLKLVSEETDFIVVHDGARPLITPSLIESCLTAAHETGAAMVAIPVKDTLKDVDRNHNIRHTVDRSTLWQAQTPQVVRADILKAAFTEADQTSFVGTDEASFLEQISHPMCVVEGSERNIKITRPEDLRIAEALLMEKQSGISNAILQKIGHGYDAHRFCEGRPLILGGVTISHPLGLLGHSDADVLTHALCDAILGALGEGDIGNHFPDSDPQYKGISSILLLEKVISLASEKGYTISNADITVIAQKPKLAPHFPDMKKNLSAACGVSLEQINVKGTTTEQMGFTGREEGISCHAAVLLQSGRRTP